MAQKNESQAIIDLGNQWAKRKAEGASQEELNAIHDQAEKLRAQEGYSGGSDGSQRVETAPSAPTTTSGTAKKAKVNVAAETTVKDAEGKTASDYGNDWATAKAAGASQAELDAIHQKAEDVRALSGYSADSDGSEYKDLKKASTDTQKELEAANRKAGDLFTLDDGTYLVKADGSVEKVGINTAGIDTNNSTDMYVAWVPGVGMQTATPQQFESIKSKGGYILGGAAGANVEGFTEQNGVGNAVTNWKDVLEKNGYASNGSYAYYTKDDAGTFGVGSNEPNKVNDYSIFNYDSSSNPVLSIDENGNIVSTPGQPGSKSQGAVTPEAEAEYNIRWRQEDLYNTLDDTNATIEDKYTKLGDLLTEKANAQVDEATRQAINTLNQTLAEYTTLYNQERSKAAYQQAQANDNMVLRNTAAGDMGGIGNKLYSDQQANYDSQITSIDLQQANLMSDTARQIADLVAQGEYNKAQNVLEIGIANLQNMINQENQLISWKMNLAGNLDNLDFDKMQFDEGVREYNLSLALNKLQLGMFSEEDARSLGVDPAQAKAFVDRINALADYDLDSARLSLEAAGLDNQQARENSFYNKLERGLFNEADAIALGIDPSQAKEYADYINTMFQLNKEEAEAQLAKLLGNLSGGGSGSGSGSGRGAGGGGGGTPSEAEEEYAPGTGDITIYRNGKPLTMTSDGTNYTLSDGSQLRDGDKIKDGNISYIYDSSKGDFVPMTAQQEASATMSNLDSLKKDIDNAIAKGDQNGFADAYNKYRAAYMNVYGKLPPEINYKTSRLANVNNQIAKMEAEIKKYASGNYGNNMVYDPSVHYSDELKALYEERQRLGGSGAPASFGNGGR